MAVKTKKTSTMDILRARIAKDWNAPGYENPDSSHWSIVEAIIDRLNEGFVEDAALADKYRDFICIQCGMCHDGKCGGGGDGVRGIYARQDHS